MGNSITLQCQWPACSTYYGLRHTNTLHRETQVPVLSIFAENLIIENFNIRANVKSHKATSPFRYPNCQQVIAAFLRAWRTTLPRNHVACCQYIALQKFFYLIHSHWSTWRWWGKSFQPGSSFSGLSFSPLVLGFITVLKIFSTND